MPYSATLPPDCKILCCSFCSSNFSCNTQQAGIQMLLQLPAMQINWVAEFELQLVQFTELVICAKLGYIKLPKQWCTV